MPDAFKQIHNQISMSDHSRSSTTGRQLIITRNKRLLAFPLSFPFNYFPVPF